MSSSGQTRSTFLSYLLRFTSADNPAKAERMSETVRLAVIVLDHSE
jgi:hypothetical protein